MSSSQYNLMPLSDLKDYRVANDTPDVRNWRVISQDGVIVGKVVDLIVDRQGMRVRYMDVRLNKDLFDRTVDRRVLIPIGVAGIDREDKRILLDSTNISDLLTLPPFAPGPITRDYEVMLRDAFSTEQRGAEQPDREFYEHDHFDERRFYGGAEARSYGAPDARTP